MAQEEGRLVEFFHEADPADVAAWYVLPPEEATRARGMPRLLQSHGWLEGSLLDFASLEEARAACDPAEPSSWPRVQPAQGLLFADRKATKGPTALLEPLRVPSSRLRRRPAVRQPPLLSVLFVRWGGKHGVGEGHEHEPEGEGGWGKYGCPPGDWYMSALVKEGVMAHPHLGRGESTNGSIGEAGGAVSFSFEVFSLFVATSAETAAIAHMAPALEARLSGHKKASFWMLWPAEWEDWGTADYAGYVQRQAMFASMRACEAAGIRSAFPHPADQYELITSKAWMVTLATNPEARLPAAVFVEQAAVLADPTGAAIGALAALARVRAANPFAEDGRPSPSLVNKDVIKKGVVKVGWSWEARFVLHFVGEKQLASKLQEILLADGCQSTVCIVQEWVDFDFEIRLFFLPPADWTPESFTRPVRFEYNGWDRPEQGRPGSFLKLSREKCLQRWEQDAAALEHAQEQAVQISQGLLRHLNAAHRDPVPMIRLDFMVLRLAPGQARVIFGEYCEMGACCISWEEGPPTIWRAALDYALR